MTSLRTAAAVFLVTLAITLSAVWVGGGWRADAAGDPDEPAHAVTSLMLRDFIVDGHWAQPLAFAQQYYLDFPKVAIGHYPPMYYLLAGLVLLIAPKIGALLALQAVLLAALGTLVFIAGRKIAGVVPALCAAALSTLLPLMWNLSLHVMADLLLVCLCLLAILCWARYCDRPSFRSSLGFGTLAALAILTKGSGLMLAAVPPLVVILRREWRELRSWSWWCAALPVVLLAGPWLFFTAGITKEGMTGQTTIEFLGTALVYYGQTLPQQVGYVWLTLAVIGGGYWLYRAATRSLSALEAAFLSSLAGGMAVILLIPAGISERYLAPLVPALALLAAAGALTLAQFLPGRLRQWAVLLLMAAAFAPVAKVPAKEVHGFTDAVAHVQSSADPSPKDIWLVSSDPRGEGGVIAEAAFRLKRRSPSPLRIYRAGKELASSDWMGRGYQASVKTEAEVLAHLDKLGVRWVFLDLSAPKRLHMPHEKLLESALNATPSQWTLERRQPVTRQAKTTGELLIYRSVARNPKS